MSGTTPQPDPLVPPEGYQYQPSTGQQPYGQVPSEFDPSAYQGSPYQGAQYQGTAYQDVPYGQYQGQYDPNAAYQDPGAYFPPMPAYGQMPYMGPGQPYVLNPNGTVQPVAMWSPKSKLAAGLLGIFLGTFGIHNFYLGHTSKAVAQLLISVLSFGMLAWVSSIWGLVEGILILASSTGTSWDLDANGYPMMPIGANNSY